MSHEHRVKHQIHYASLEEISKKNYDKKFTTVITHIIFRTVTIKNVHVMQLYTEICYMH